MEVISGVLWGALRINLDTMATLWGCYGDAKRILWEYDSLYVLRVLNFSLVSLKVTYNERRCMHRRQKYTRFV